MPATPTRVVEGRVSDLPEGLEASRLARRSTTPRRRPRRPTRWSRRPPRDAPAADAAETRPRPAATAAADAADAADAAGRGRDHRLTPRRRPPSRHVPAILRAVPDRLPAPGPSFLREQPVRIGDRTLPGRDEPAVRGARRLVAGRSSGSPTSDGVVSFRDVAPAAGPPPDPPLGAPRAGGQRRPVRAHPRGRRAAPDAPRAGRPAGRPDATVAQPRWRSARPSGSSLRGPPRCARTACRDGPGRASSEPSKGSTGLNGRARVDSRSNARPVRRFHGGAPPSRGARARPGSRRRRPTHADAASRDDDGRRRRRPRSDRRATMTRPTGDDRRPTTADDGDDEPTTTTSRSTPTTRSSDPPIAGRPSPTAGGPPARARRSATMAARAGPRGRAGASALVVVIVAVLGSHPAVQRRASTCGPTRSGSRASGSIRSSGRGSARPSVSASAPSLVAAIVLLGNLWLAGRLTPPHGRGRQHRSARWSIASTRRPRRPTSGAADTRSTVRRRARPVVGDQPRNAVTSTSATCPT